MRNQLFEGDVDDYKQFLRTASNTRLSAASDDFYYQIQSLETPSLLIRKVETHGQTANTGEPVDAFFGLILSLNAGFSTSAMPTAEASPQHPTLHWHLNNKPYCNYHRDSKVIYLRLESSSLIPALVAQGLSVDQLANLSGVAASPAVVLLIGELEAQLSQANTSEQPALAMAFVLQLAVELRTALGRPSGTQNNACAHVGRAIAWLQEHIHQPIKQADLSQAQALNPRTLQDHFKSQTNISPMRYLKLARLSQLRQLAWRADHQHFSSRQLMRNCGLSDTAPNRQAYNQIYGNSITVDRQALSTAGGEQIQFDDLTCAEFASVPLAVAYLQSLTKLQNIAINDKLKIEINVTTFG